MRKVILCLLIFLFSIGTVSAFSLSGGGDWKYYREITIKENSGKTLTNYQILVELNSANFDFSKAKSDGSDIRFSTDSQELSYWIEEWDSNAKKAKIWVKVPLIPANGQTTIKMWYGNPSAGAVGDGDKVFEFFDDFEDGFDTTKWKAFKGSFEYPTGIPKTNGYKVEYTTKGGRKSNWLHIWNTGGPGETGGTAISGEIKPCAQCIVELKYALETQKGRNYIILADEDSESIMVIYAPIGKGVGDNKSLYWYNRDKFPEGDIAAYQDTGLDLFTNVLYKFKFEISSVNPPEVYGWVNKQFLGNIAYSTKVSREKPRFIWFNARHEGSNFWVDDIIVRKYASPEPTITIPQEHPTPKPTPTPPKPPEGKIKAVWLYDYDRYDLPTLMNDLKSAGINTIFLSTDVNNIWKYERFVKTAHENGIEVHAMILEIADNKEEGIYDYTNFYKNPNHKDEAVRDVEEILNYNEKSLGAFDGINIDIEPYTSDLWNSNREDVWNDYMEVISAIKERTNGRIELSANILYDSRDYTEDRIKDLASVLDFFVIMAYDSGGSGFNTPEEIKDAVAQEMGSVRGQGAKAVIGIGIHEGFGDKSDVESCINDLFDYYSDDPAFLGISIFRYHSYSELPETKKTPEGNRSTDEQKKIPGFECIFAITLLAVAYILRWLKNE